MCPLNLPGDTGGTIITRSTAFLEVSVTGGNIDILIKIKREIANL
jgi:hypothetical protein